MGPVSLAPCYVCGQNFSPQSITFHEPKCLIRWRSENNSLRPEKRCPTPIKSEDGVTLTNDCVWTCVRCYNIYPASKRGEHMATCTLPKIERPKTRTVNRGGSNGLSLIHSSKHGNYRLLRPQTKTLQRPTPNLEHPVIDGLISDIHKSLSNENLEQDKIETNEKKEENATIVVTPASEDIPKNTKKKDGKSKGSQKENAKDERSKTNSFPPPCKSCQRNDAPERFHSHHRSSCCPDSTKKGNSANSTDSESNKKKSADVADKKSSQSESPPESKPNTLHPGKKKKSDSLSPVKGPPPPPAPAHHQHTAQVKAKNNKNKNKNNNNNSNKTNGGETVADGNGKPPEETTSTSDDETNKLNSQIKRPRIVICYLCGREFGTRSYPFHEPHCIERWQRDNQALPAELRRAMPARPTTGEGFSDTAWETFQAQLVPCPSCGRTFFPNRLPVHQKACKGPDKGAPGPITSSNYNSCTLPSVKNQSAQENHEEIDKKSVPFRPVLMTCYICGRQFGSMSLALHEPQCLKKLKLENDQLPPAQQRPEPRKPKAVFKEDGTLDSLATEEAAWKSHLVQLVPCRKCGRTFFPDRLESHEPNCKADPVTQGSKIPKLAAVVS